MSALSTAYLARLPRFDCRCVSVCEGERETPVIAWIVWALNCTPYCRLVCAHVARLKTAAIMNVRRSWKTGWRIARTHSIVWSETAFEWNAREWRAERLSGQIQVKFKPLATGTQCAESGFHVNNVKTERNTQSKKKKKKTAAKATLNNINFLCLIVQCCARVQVKKTGARYEFNWPHCITVFIHCNLRVSRKCSSIDNCPKLRKLQWLLCYF